MCFVGHKLVIETDGDGQPYYENDQIRQNLIEDHCFNFIKINPDLDPDAGFDIDVDISKAYNYINKSSVELAESSAEKSLKERFTKRIIQLHVKHFLTIEIH